MKGVKRKKGFTVCVCVLVQRERERREREGEGGVSGPVCVQGDWFGGGLGCFAGGLGLTWEVYVIKLLLNFFFLVLSQKHILGVKKVVWDVFFKSSYYHKNIYWVLRKWFGVV